MDFEPIDMIAIVYDVDFEYVCNIFISFDAGEYMSLAKSHTDSGCELDLDAIDNVDNAFILVSEVDYPIVGFHGRTQNDKLTDLGVIWLDANNENCQKRLPLDVQQKMMEEGIPTAEEAWEKLSDKQKMDGKELEALMTYHSLTQSKQTQMEIREKLQVAIDKLEEEQIELLEKIQMQPEGGQKDDLLKNIKWHQN